MTKQFTRGDIDALAQRYRANLINSLSGFKSAILFMSVQTRLSLA